MFSDGSPTRLLVALAYAAGARAFCASPLPLSPASALPRRLPPPCLQLFPDGAAARSPPPPPPLLPRDLVGFWTVYDDLAADDSLAAVSSGDSPTSLFSSRMVLRADGQTSRGSDFPGGEWELTTAPSGEGKQRKRLRATLRSRKLRQELRLDGLVFRLDMGSVELLERSVGSPAAPAGNDAPPTSAGDEAPAPPPLQVRVVGKSSRWDVASPASPVLLGRGDFSMVRLEVDRTTLIPTIKPHAAAVEADPEQIRHEQEWQRLRDYSEADEIRRAIDEVRALKRERGDAWRDADEPREGEDFWRLGEEPRAERGAEER